MRRAITLSAPDDCGWVVLGSMRAGGGGVGRLRVVATRGSMQKSTACARGSDTCLACPVTHSIFTFRYVFLQPPCGRYASVSGDTGGSHGKCEWSGAAVNGSVKTQAEPSLRLRTLRIFGSTIEVARYSENGGSACAATGCPAGDWRVGLLGRWSAVVASANTAEASLLIDRYAATIFEVLDMYATVRGTSTSVAGIGSFRSPADSSFAYPIQWTRSAH